MIISYIIVKFFIIFPLFFICKDFYVSTENSFLLLNGIKNLSATFFTQHWDECVCIHLTSLS